MPDLLDTNVFILSIYDSLYLKAVKKFIEENNEPVPFFLHWELSNKIPDLMITLKKIFYELKKGKDSADISELNYLETKYVNVYNVLKNKTNTFNLKSNFLGILDSSIERLHSINAWIDTVSYYPDNKDRERKILKKNKKLLRRLQKVRGLHYSDLRIICISDNYYKNSSTKLSFITRDKGILDNKDILEKEFKSVFIKKVGDFVG